MVRSRLFSLLLLSISLTVFSPLNHQMARAQDSKSTTTPRKDQCTISGMVVKLAGDEPLRKARVRVESIEDRTHSISVVTDAGGHFEMKGVDPGSYHLHVSRVGFVTQEYGQRKPEGPGATLTLRPRQDMKDLVFRMIPSGVIAGRILDEDGEPLPSVRVSALREVYSEGKRNLAAGAYAESNDLGEYRLFGLAPGRYFISAVYSQWERTGGNGAQDEAHPSAEGYAKMYYPGTPDRGKATPIAIKAGEEIPSIEILMHQVLVYHVRGRVYNQITHRPGSDSYVLLLPRASGRFGDFGDQFARVEKRDGSFDISEVLPGSYSLAAFWADQGKEYISRMPIEVGNADVEGVAVTIGAGSNINGHVVWDGRPSMDKDQMYVYLRSTDSTPFFSPGARVNLDGSFTVQEVGDGAYYVEPDGGSKDCYVKDVRYAGSSALEDGFTVARGSAATLEVTISSRGARVQGSVANDEGLPGAGVWVALVPDSAHQSQHRLYKSQTTDQYGHFDLRGIAPGDYQLFSWDQAEEGAWEDPEFMKPFVEKKQGEKITVQEGDTKSVNVVVIKTASTEDAK